MCKKCWNWLKDFDQFGIPVSLTYKREFTFNTPCGGCATIFIILIFISQVSLAILDFFLNHNLSQSTSYEYWAHPGNTNTTWTLDTENDTLVGALRVLFPYKAEMQDIDIDQYFRIQFYQFEMTNGSEFKTIWVNAAKCKDMAMYDHLEDQLNTSEEDVDYVCPDVESITLLNYPLLYQNGNGTNFSMVVNNCTQAKQIEYENGLTPYNNNTECASFEEIEAMTSKLSLQSLLMTQAS